MKDTEFAINNALSSVVSGVLPDLVRSGDVSKVAAYIMQYQSVCLLMDSGIDTCNIFNYGHHCDACFTKSGDENIDILLTAEDIQDYILDTESVSECVCDALNRVVNTLSTNRSIEYAIELLKHYAYRFPVHFVPFIRVCPSCLIKLCSLYDEYSNNGGFTMFIQEHGQKEWYSRVADRIDEK